MRHINSNSFCIALLELLLLETLLYFTVLSHIKSIVFFRVLMFPFGHRIKERPLGALPNIINIRKKCTAVFNISLSIGFNSGLLPQFIPCHLLSVSILY